MTWCRTPFCAPIGGFDALRGSDAKAWLLTIVRNCHLTAAKQQQRRAFVPLPEENDVARWRMR